MFVVFPISIYAKLPVNNHWSWSIHELEALIFFPLPTNKISTTYAENALGVSPLFLKWGS